MTIKALATLATLLLLQATSAQQKYLVVFKPGAGTATAVEGDTQFAQLKPEKALDLIAYQFGAESAVDLGSPTGGSGGSSRINFAPLNILARAESKATTQLLANLTLGGHFDEVLIHGYTATDSQATPIKTFTLSLLLVVVKGVEIEGTEGDESIVNITLDWGAMKMESFGLDQHGSSSQDASMEWSRVLNTPNYAVD